MARAGNQTFALSWLALAFLSRSGMQLVSAESCPAPHDDAIGGTCSATENPCSWYARVLNWCFHTCTVTCEQGWVATRPASGRTNTPYTCKSWLPRPNLCQCDVSDPNAALFHLPQSGNVLTICREDYQFPAGTPLQRRGFRTHVCGNAFPKCKCAPVVHFAEVTSPSTETANIQCDANFALPSGSRSQEFTCGSGEAPASCECLPSVDHASAANLAPTTAEVTCDANYALASLETSVTFQCGEDTELPVCECRPAVSDATIVNLTVTTARIDCTGDRVIADQSAGVWRTTATYDCEGTEPVPVCGERVDVVPVVAPPIASVSVGAVTNDNACSYLCSGMTSPTNSTMGFAYSGVDNVPDADGLNGSELFACQPEPGTARDADICVCRPEAENASVVPIYQTSSNYPSSYPAGFTRSVSATVTCDEGKVFRGLVGRLKNVGRGRMPVTSIRWNCLDSNGGVSIGDTASLDWWNSIPAPPLQGLGCREPPTCPTMPFGTCTTSGAADNLDCTLSCPANYVLDFSPATNPYTLQCSWFDLPQADFESCICKVPIPSATGGRAGQCAETTAAEFPDLTERIHHCRPICFGRFGQFNAAVNEDDGSPVYYDCRVGGDPPECP